MKNRMSAIKISARQHSQIMLLNSKSLDNNGYNVLSACVKFKSEFRDRVSKR